MASAKTIGHSRQLHRQVSEKTHVSLLNNGFKAVRHFLGQLSQSLTVKFDEIMNANIARIDLPTCTIFYVGK